MSTPKLPSEIPILIVGGGPAALALACTLLNKGVPPSSVLIFEKESLTQKHARQHQSRALLINARTLECLEESVDDPLAGPPSRPTTSEPSHTLAVDERIASTVQTILSRARLLDCMTFRDPRYARALLTTEFKLIKDETRYPFLTLHPQPSTESILESRFHTLGGTIHREWRFESFDCQGQSEIGKPVTVKLVHSTGARAEIQTKILVGADGGHSAVRRGTGIEFTGYTYPEMFVVADLKFKSTDWVKGPTGYDQFYSQAGSLLVMPLPHGLLRVVTDDRSEVKAGTVETTGTGGHTEDRKVPSQAELQELVIARGPRLAAGDDRNMITAVTWSSRFHIAHRIMPTFVKGPICFIGDAAHVHSPAGGQGMNTGIQDGISLGLALSGYFQAGSTLSPTAGDSLTQILATWSTKRRGIASQVLVESHKLTRMRTRSNPILLWLQSWLLVIFGLFPVLLRGKVRQLLGLNYR